MWAASAECFCDYEGLSCSSDTGRFQKEFFEVSFPPLLLDFQVLVHSLLLLLLSFLILSAFCDRDSLHGISGSLQVNRTLFISPLSHSFALPLLLRLSKLTFLHGLVTLGSSRRCCSAWHTLTPLSPRPAMLVHVPQPWTEGTDSSWSCSSI